MKQSFALDSSFHKVPAPCEVLAKPADRNFPLKGRRKCVAKEDSETQMNKSCSEFGVSDRLGFESTRQSTLSVRHRQIVLGLSISQLEGQSSKGVYTLLNKLVVDKKKSN
jgi:hypothetical protein